MEASLHHSGTERREADAVCKELLEEATHTRAGLRCSAGIPKEAGATHMRRWLLLLGRRLGCRRQFFARRNVGHVGQAGDVALGRVVNADAVVVQ